MFCVAGFIRSAMAPSTIDLSNGLNLEVSVPSRSSFSYLSIEAFCVQFAQDLAAIIRRYH